MSDPFATLLSTREVRQALNDALPQLVAAWSDGSRLRKATARLASPLVAGGFDPEASSTTLEEALSDPATLAATSLAAITSVLDLLGAASAAWDRLSPEARSRVAATIVEGLDWQSVAAAFGRLTTAAAAPSSGDPTTAELLREPIKALVAAIDFGALKEALESSAESAVEVAETTGEEVWRYPAKVLCLMSVAPALVSAGLRIAAGAAAPLNRLAPDLVADVVLSLVRELRPGDVAGLVDELSELVRKLHTGGQLIGDGGRSLLPSDLADRLAAVLHEVDLDALLTARSLLADTLEETEAAVLEALADHPQLAREMVVARVRTAARGIRRGHRRQLAIERALSDDEVAEELADALGEIDVEALAESASDLLEHVNKVVRRSPGALGNAVARAAEGIDPGTLRTTARWLAADLVVALEPVACDVLPPVISAVAELISGSRHDDRMRQAVTALRDALEAD